MTSLLTTVIFIFYDKIFNLYHKSTLFLGAFVFYDKTPSFSKIITNLIYSPMSIWIPGWTLSSYSQMHARLLLILYSKFEEKTFFTFCNYYKFPLT